MFNNIQNNFNKASVSYETVANVQQQAAALLVDILLKNNNVYPKTILDAGTGTGYVVERLLDHYPESTYLLNDIAENMLKVCQQKFSKYSKVMYIQGDMSVLNNNPVDIITSNLALQWVDDLWQTLQLLYAKSSKFFAFSTLIDGTFHEWNRLIHSHQPNHFHKFPDPNKMINFCMSLKGASAFDYQIIDFPLHFNSPADFVRYLKKLGATALPQTMPVGKLKRFLNMYKSPIKISYKIFFGLFKKANP